MGDFQPARIPSGQPVPIFPAKAVACVIEYEEVVVPQRFDLAADALSQAEQRSTLVNQKLYVHFDVGIRLAQCRGKFLGVGARVRNAGHSVYTGASISLNSDNYSHDSRRRE